MANEVRLIPLNDSMQDAVIVNINVKNGDKVSKSDVIAEIETDKATVELEASASGFVKAVLVEKGQNVAVNSVIMVIGDENEQLSCEYLESIKPKISQNTDSASTKNASDEIPADLPARTADLSQVKLGQTVKLSRIQKMAGNKMVQSKQQIPCFYLTTDADVTELVKFRADFNEKSDIKVSFNDFIIKSLAIGLEKYPVMTGRLGDNEIILADSINIGLAVTAGDDLFAPVLKGIESKNIAEIAKNSQEMVTKTRDFALKPADLEGACGSLTNLGAFGIDSFVPIVIPSQCFIIGAGRIIDTPAGAADAITIKKVMSLTISVDHRIANGAYAAQFLDFVKKMLENPESLV